MTGKLWQCPQCERLINRFVNGNTCPDCGRYSGRSLISLNRGP